MMTDNFPEQFNRHETSAETPTEAIENEFTLLMSLALDDLLDDEESARFRRYLHVYPTLAAEWQSWQKLDDMFRATPSAMPPAGFAADMQVRLIQYERRRRLMWGLGFGVILLALWVGLMAGAVSFGAFVVIERAEWLSNFIHFSTRAAAGIQSWWVVTAGAADMLLSTEQARLFMAGYLAAGLAMLAGWVLLLRRTTKAEPVFIRTA